MLNLEVKVETIYAGSRSASDRASISIQKTEKGAATHQFSHGIFTL
jgi:hypothetical protein